MTTLHKMNNTGSAMEPKATSDNSVTTPDNSVTTSGKPVTTSGKSVTTSGNSVTTLSNYDACLFDFDGVIVDSEVLHEQTKRQTLDRLGINYPQDIFEDYQGSPEGDFFNFVAKELSDVPVSTMVETKRTLYRQYYDQLVLVDGVEDFVDQIKLHVEQTAIVTSSTIDDVRVVVSRYFGPEAFNQILSCEDTSRHKPFPDPYIKAAELCQVELPRCLVVEDSPNGIAAAKKAGCTVVGLTTTFTPARLVEAGADIIVDTYKELSMLLNMDAA